MSKLVKNLKGRTWGQYLYDAQNILCSCCSMSIYVYISSSIFSKLLSKQRRRKTFFQRSLALSCQLPTGGDSEAWKLKLVAFEMSQCSAEQGNFFHMKNCHEFAQIYLSFLSFSGKACSHTFQLYNFTTLKAPCQYSPSPYDYGCNDTKIIKYDSLEV